MQKEFLVDNLTQDLSPVSVKSLLNFYHPYGLYAIRMRYSISGFSTYCRIGGLGYRNLGRLHNSSHPSIRRMNWDKPNLPVDWWLGDGQPLSPYVRARVVLYLLERFKPRAPVPPPVDLFMQPGMCDFLEWSLLRSWMVSWLHSLHWYCSVAMDPWVTISQLLEGGPVVCTHWNIKRKDENLVRLGLVWKCRSLVDKIGRDYSPPIF